MSVRAVFSIFVRRQRPSLESTPPHVVRLCSNFEKIFWVWRRQTQLAAFPPDNCTILSSALPVIEMTKSFWGGSFGTCETNLLIALIFYLLFLLLFSTIAFCTQW